MNRTYTIDVLKRFGIILVSALGLLLIHVVARCLWAFGNVGVNLNPVSRAMYDRYLNGGLADAGLVENPNTYQYEVPRTIWNYNTSMPDIFGTHILAFALIAGTVLVVFLLVQLVMWLFTGHGIFGFPKYEYTGPDCTDPACSCVYHSDETFDYESNEWRDATKEEMAQRDSMVPNGTR